MKKTNYILWIAGAVMMLSAVSCARPEMDAPETVKPSAGMTFRLGIPDVKTSLGPSENQSRKVFWSNGDKVAINGIESVALSNLPDNATTADFMLPPNSEEPAAPYKIIYPSAIYKDASTVTLPAVQTWKSGTFAHGMFPMAGYSEEGFDAGMKYLCATLKISVKLASGDNPDTDKITLVTFKGKGGEQVSGDFTVDYENATLTGASEATADKSVSVSLNQALSSTALDIFVVVPAGTYSGFTVTVQDAKGHTMQKNLNHNQELVAGKLYNMPEFAFVPTGEATGIEIWNAEDLIEFARAYNAKEYENYPGGLIATVMDNIVFDAESSADFNATGGIGTAFGGGNYFKGTFNGNGKTISKLSGTVALFGGTDDGSIIRDLTIDNSCSFTFTHPNTTDAYFGTVSSYHKGLMKDVTVNASVSLAAVNSVAYITSIGGLSGRMAGSGVIDQCTYGGRISVPSGFSTESSSGDSVYYVYLGGLVGFTQSSTCEIKNSHMAGSIDFAGRVISSITTNATLRLGGIIGFNRTGSVTNCDTACLDDAQDGAVSFTASNGTTYFATIVNRTSQTYYMTQGGIAGYNTGTINGCTNRAKIFNNILNTGTDGKASDSNSRYMRWGGIVGMNWTGSIINSDNYGEIINMANPRIQYCGGIIGFNGGTDSIVSGCTNQSSGTISFISTGTIDEDVRQAWCGGVFGHNESSSVSDIHNNANLDISCIEADTDKYLVGLGGIAGDNTADLDGNVSAKNITNSGMVYASFNASGASGNGIQIGGIVGQNSASINNAINSGYVLFYGISGEIILKNIYLGGIVGRMTSAGSISGCINNSEGGGNAGEVYFYFNNNATKHANNFAGGILGYSDKGVKISGCSNNGYVHGGNGGTAKTPASCFVGGIVAYLSGEGAEISSCINNGNIYNHHRNNNSTETQSTYTGGIAGYLLGSDESTISVSNCTVSPTSFVASHRGYVGGVVGYAKYSEIKDCSHNKDFTLSSNPQCTAYYVGGIVGWAVNSTLTSCSWSGNTINTSQLQTNGAGGIAAKMDGGTLDGCSSYATSIQLNGNSATGGALVGTVSNNPTIKNCHYKSTINNTSALVAGTGTFTDGGGNVADL